jgi:hypothetical protein
MENIEIISVHYKTPKFIYEQYESVRKIYPYIDYRIIDGSDDKKNYFEDLESIDKNFSVKRFGYNIHHGPGMDYALKTSNKDFVLIIDSDITIKCELINDMLKIFNGYSVGKKIIVNECGFESWQKTNNCNSNYIYEYIHPYTTLIKKDEYLKHKPFIKHGAPCIEAMIDLKNKNLTRLLIDFHIEDYVNLKTRGTRKIWGINL